MYVLCTLNVCITYVFVCIDYIWYQLYELFPWNGLSWRICTCQWILTVSAVITATEFLIFHTSLSQYWMIRWPDHGPRVDVKEFAPGSWRIGLVTCALREVRLLLACHWKRNCTGVTNRYQRQAAQNTRDRHYPHPRLRGWHVKHLCPDVSSASPPIHRPLVRTVVPQGLDHGALALHKTALVRPNVESEQQCNAPIPAVVHGWSVSRSLSAIELGGWDEKDVILWP
jgi:hypothetical protein